MKCLGTRGGKNYAKKRDKKDKNFYLNVVASVRKTENEINVQRKCLTSFTVH